jgi:hypothetical protein
MNKEIMLRVWGCSAEERFNSLVKKWKEETAYASSMTDIVYNAHYQQIIGLGWECIPYIMKELREDPSHYFYALRMITGVDPIQEKHRGMLEGMTEDWLMWFSAQEWYPFEKIENDDR